MLLHRSEKIERLTRVIIARTYVDSAVAVNDVGTMHKMCMSCNALHWVRELEGRICCHHGRVITGKIRPWPLFLTALFRGPAVLSPAELASMIPEESQLLHAHPNISAHFRRCARKYNNSVSTASFRADRTTIKGHGPQSLNVHGQIYRRLSHLAPGHPVAPRHEPVPVCAEGKEEKEEKQGSGGGQQDQPIASWSSASARPARAFGQLYMYSPADATDKRIADANKPGMSDPLRPPVIILLDEMLRRTHELVRCYVTAYERVIQHPTANVKISLLQRTLAQQKNYELPPPSAIMNHLAGLIIGAEEGVMAEGADALPTIELESRSNQYGSLILNTTSPHCDPSLYPLLFPHGELGWYIGIPFVKQPGSARRAAASEQKQESDDEPEAEEKREVPDCEQVLGKVACVTMMKFYQSRLAVRISGGDQIHYGGRIHAQWVIDAWAKIEDQNLRWCAFNQKTLRSETYAGLHDHVEHARDGNDLARANIGRAVVLPSSFSGSPRHMNECYQDAMAVVRLFGKPDLFITMTCNPNWPEILAEVPAPQLVEERPDVVTRVFRLKFLDLLHQVVQRHAFGECLGYVWVTEFQKRGLPHCHLIVFLAARHKALRADAVDALVRADVPDPVLEPQLHAAVIKHMVHGPCAKPVVGRATESVISHHARSATVQSRRSAAWEPPWVRDPSSQRYIAVPHMPCQQDKPGTCSKRFPKDFQEETIVDDRNAYPLYRRPRYGPA